MSASTHVGQDSEFFLWDTKENKLVMAHEVGLPLQRDSEPMKGYSTGGSCKPYRFYRDGAAMEIGTAPATCRAFIWEDMEGAWKHAQSHLKIPDHIVPTHKPLVRVTRDMFDDVPDDVRQLGCSWAFNAYRGKPCRPEANPVTFPFRTAGAHLHLSGPMSKTFLKNKRNAMKLGKIIDFFVGIPATFLLPYDDEFQRRELYGRAGEFRIQQYEPAQGLDAGFRADIGVEYRSLSPRIYRHPAIFSFLTGILKYTVGNSMMKLMEVPLSRNLTRATEKAINTGRRLETLVEDWEKMMMSRPTDMFGGFPHPRYTKGAIETMRNEIRKIIQTEGLDTWQLDSYRWPDLHKGYHEYMRQWGERLGR